MYRCVFYRFWSNDYHGQLVSFYANLPIQRVFIGEERGGVVWKA